MSPECGESSPPEDDNAENKIEKNYKENKKSGITRRDFLKAAGIAGAAGIIPNMSAFAENTLENQATSEPVSLVREVTLSPEVRERYLEQNKNFLLYLARYRAMGYEIDPIQDHESTFCEYSDRFFNFYKLSSDRLSIENAVTPKQKQGAQRDLYYEATPGDVAQLEYSERSQIAPELLKDPLFTFTPYSIELDAGRFGKPYVLIRNWLSKTEPIIARVDIDPKDIGRTSNEITQVIKSDRAMIDTENLHRILDELTTQEMRDHIPLYTVDHGHKPSEEEKKVFRDIVQMSNNLYFKSANAESDNWDPFEKDNSKLYNTPKDVCDRLGPYVLNVNGYIEEISFVVDQGPIFLEQETWNEFTDQNGQVHPKVQEGYDSLGNFICSKWKFIEDSSNPNVFIGTRRVEILPHSTLQKISDVGNSTSSRLDIDLRAYDLGEIKGVLYQRDVPFIRETPEGRKYYSNVPQEELRLILTDRNISEIERGMKVVETAFGRAAGDVDTVIIPNTNTDNAIFSPPDPHAIRLYDERLKFQKNKIGKDSVAFTASHERLHAVSHFTRISRDNRWRYCFTKHAEFYPQIEKSPIYSLSEDKFIKKAKNTGHASDNEEEFFASFANTIIHDEGWGTTMKWRNKTFRSAYLDISKVLVEILDDYSLQDIPFYKKLKQKISQIEKMT